MSVQIQMTQIKRFVDSLESISSESMSLLFKTRGKNMEKNEVSVLFVQKQKEKISHTSFDEFKIKVQRSNCLRGWLAFYIHSYASHVSRMVITFLRRTHTRRKEETKKPSLAKTQGKTIINLPFKHVHQQTSYIQISNNILTQYLDTYTRHCHSSSSHLHLHMRLALAQCAN